MIAGRLSSGVANDTAKRLLARVRELRKALNLTQEEFAEQGGFDYKYYQHLEAGRKLDMKISTLEKLAKACRIELWELLNFESEIGVVGEKPPEKLPDAPARKRRKR